MIYPSKACMALFIVMPVFIQQVQAQRSLTKEDSAWFSNNIEFIQQAPAVLSSSIQQKNWKELSNFAANWKLSEKPSEEFILAIQLLNHIRNKQFFVIKLPANYMQLLEAYAYEIDAANNNPHFKYYISLSSVFRYNATAEAEKIFKILGNWAQQLKSSRQLSKTEIFFCDVFAGNIARPKRALNDDEESYPDLAAFDHYVQQQISHCDSIALGNRRSAKSGTAALMLGSWMPTGNASLLGNAFSFGMLIGYRNKKNEYDLIGSARFPHSTNQTYYVARSDSLFSSNYYDGFYVGFDYTRYFIHKPKYEIGFTSAIGYDGFDFTSQSGDSLAGKNITPEAIGSFDFSNGIRIKYFLRPGLYIGIAAKYHFINYCNKGGTDVGGNAFTIELLLGSH
ncbi:MAG TPA: hypothetical protein VMH01_10115 [Puia sp.]|nr:hypothetical protein [Puia sp.]